MQRSRASQGHGSGFSRIDEAICRSRRTKRTTNSNFIGFIVEFGFPKATRGPDYSVTFTMADPYKTEISINMFADKIEYLPHFRCYKPIILLYNVAVKYENDKVCGVCYAKSSSYALFDVKSDRDDPLQTSLNFDLQNVSTSCINRMRACSDNYETSAAKNQYLCSIKDLGTMAFLDLVCQVLHVEKAGPQEWILFLWDGNDAPPLPIWTNLEDEEENSLQLDIETTALNMPILRRFPCVGTVLRVITDIDVTMHIQDMGQWMKVRNMKIDNRSGLWFGTFLPTTKLRFLHEDEQIVKEYKRAMDERALGKDGRLPFSSNPISGLTVIDSLNYPYATLMDIMTQTEAEVVVRCVVRVVAMSPADVDKFQWNGEYRIILTLEDPTARIHAFLDGDHGDTFFEDLSPYTIRMKMNELLGVPIPQQHSEDNRKIPRNPPWIHCCVKSNSNRLYYICQTKMVA